VTIWIIEKETRDKQLSIELRVKGVITTLGGLFLFSRQKEIDRLLARRVFKMIQRDTEELRGAKIFSSRIVDEVKGKDTTTLYKKSR